MKGPVIFLLALPVLAVLFSCASTSFAGPKPYRIPEDFFGISPDRINLDEAAALLDEFNAVWIRTTIRWTNVEPEEGVWNFERWDNYVDRAKAAGKKVLFILAFDSEWLYSDKREHRDLTEREIPYFLKYVEQVVTRYKGRVDAFEIWNEPNAFFWDGSDEHFFALSTAAAKKIKETDPGATVLACSTFRVSASFIRGMFSSGAMEYTDGISLHPYSSDALHTVRQIDKLRKIMDEFNYDKPIWITEVGYATGGIYFSTNGLKRYPEYIVKTLGGLAARGVRNSIWYELMDEYNPGEEPDRWNPSHFFGLIYPDKSLKPGAKAFMLTARYLAGAEYRPELPLRENIPGSFTSLYFKRHDGTNVLLLWNNGRGKQVLRLTVTGTARLLRHNIVSGEAAPMQPDMVLEITRDPLFISWEGEGAALIKKE
jgi:hypothetical protein